MLLYLNVLNGLTALLSVAVQFLVLHIFGIGTHTDGYFLSLAIIQFLLTLIGGVLTTLFLPVYDEVRQIGEAAARKFTNAVFASVLVLGVATAAGAWVGAPYLLRLFASGFDKTKLDTAVGLLSIFVLAIPFQFANLFLNAYLDAQRLLALSYLGALIPGLVNLGTLLIFADIYGMASLAVAFIVSSAITFVILLVYARARAGIGLGNPLAAEARASVTRLAVRSTHMEVGSLIYSLREPITTNFLSYFGGNLITLYVLTRRIYFTLLTLANAPLLKVLMIKASGHVAAREHDKLKAALIDVVRSNTPLIALGFAGLVLLLKPLLNIFFSHSLLSTEINQLYLFFLALLPLHFVLFYQTPFVQVAYAMQRSASILWINVKFILLYLLLLLLLTPVLGSLSFAAALFVAQAACTSLVLNVLRTEITLPRLPEACLMLTTGVMIAGLVALQFLMDGEVVLRIGLQALLILGWIVLVREELLFLLRTSLTRTLFPADEI
jgi:putative peptidoglycan lipid II flippase